jgi:hypothetical protein
MSDLAIVPPVVPPCKIKPTPADPACPFHAATGPVTLEVTDVVGAVMFLKATYDGIEIPGTPSKRITFPIKAGQKNLDVVYVFTDTVKGQGELHEVCAANTFLGDCLAGTPAVRYVICA